MSFPDSPTVHDVDLDLTPGSLTAVVGESGAGKSVMVAALLGLLPRSADVSGRMHLTDGEDGQPGLRVDLADRATLARQVRGRRISLVPQSPATWITPVRTLGSQLTEAARAVQAAPTPDHRSAGAAALAAAERARFPPELLSRYPHEVSGGQLQRAALALALVGGAGVLLADEPTTGLDPELAEQALAQLRREADRGAAVLVVTHDLTAAEQVADEVVVIYAGRVVERSTATRFFAAPSHPYSAGLLDALPDRGFTPIPGDPPPPGDEDRGCSFRPRCAKAVQRCAKRPALEPVNGDGHPLVACYRPMTPPTTQERQR